MKNQNSPPPPVTRHPSRYSLTRGLGFWEITFAGQRAIFKHEQGALYVSYLLHSPPPEPIHGLALALKVKANGSAPEATAEILNPATGETVVVENDAIIQERHLWLDHAEAAGKLRRQVRQLDGMMEDRNEREAVKAELHAEIEAIEEFQRKHMRRTEDAAQKAVRAARRAINRFHSHLVKARDATGQPHPILTAFAQHIEKHILIPSARYSDRTGARARVGLAGCFTYEPPQGLFWLH